MYLDLLHKNIILDEYAHFDNYSENFIWISHFFNVICFVSPYGGIEIWVTVHC